MNHENLLKRFANSYAYFPFLCASFVFGLILLFYKDLDCTIRTILVPAFVVYIIGTSIVGYVYFELDVRNCVKAASENKKPCPQPWWATIIIWLVHISWFVLLMYYLLRKNVL